MTSKIELLFENDHILVANKPAGMLVHQTELASDDAIDLVNALREQTGRPVFAVHRLDRATSGVIAFAKSSDDANKLQRALETAEKSYLLICRGHLFDPATINHPLKRIQDSPRDKRKRQRGVLGEAAYQEAVTHYQPIATTTIDAAIDRYPSSRYSLVKAQIETGRRHQIRRHFKHISHPIIGCPKYGKSNHNNYFKNELKIGRLLLHAQQLKFVFNDEVIDVEAKVDAYFQKALDLFTDRYLTKSSEDQR